MTQSLAKSSSTGLAKYDPQKGLKTVAVAEAAEKHYARAKDATQLERAIRLKREALAEFVFWWEKLLTGARIALMDLALEARFTVWYLQLWKDGRVAWADMLKPDAIDVLTRDEYRERLAMWWANRYALEHYAAVTDEILLRRAGVR